MTAPLQVPDFDDSAIHSTSETTSTSPAFSISPSTTGNKQRTVSSTNQAIAFSHSQSGPFPAQSYPGHQLAHFTSIHLDRSPHQRLNTQSDIADQADLALATNVSPSLSSFESQPTALSTTPFLHFGPRPLYEPAGELIDERFDDFFQFDSPSTFRSIATTAENGSVPELNNHPEARNQPQLSSKRDQDLGSKLPDASVLPRSALKRKAEQLNGVDTGGPGLSTKRRSVSFEQMSTREVTSPDEAQGRPSVAQSRPGASSPHARRGRPSITSSTPKPSIETDRPPTGSGTRPIRGTKHPSGHPPSILPPEKVFPIQIGSSLFRLSGASISSDAPSYFTQFFEEQIRENPESGGVRTLYIDRDPITFRDVARHLQGYYVKPQDGSHFVKLFADAQFYSLPRLIDQLFESEIFIQIGEQHFQIPKDIFSEPGNSPNFFSLGFAVFFSTPGEVFPGLDRRGLLRPPSITPPCVPNRSAEIFAELLHLLRGYPLKIRNENHRQELLRDCRYFHLRGLEQKIIAHEISYNLQRSREEIALRLEDVKPSGISYRPSGEDETDKKDTDDESDDDEEAMSTDVGADPGAKSGGDPRHPGGWVYYARPFVDEASYEMVVEIGNESTQLDLRDMRADFHGLTKARVSSLLQVVANKMNLPTNAPWGLLVLGQPQGAATQASSPGHTPLSEDRVKVRFDHASAVSLDGEKWSINWQSALGRRMRLGHDDTIDDASVEEGQEADDSDSEDDARGETSRSAPQQQQSRQRPQQQQRQNVSAKTPSSQAKAKMSGQQNVLSSSASSRKRKRPGFGESTHAAPPTAHSGSVPPPQTSYVLSEQHQHVEQDTTWTIKTAQFRLRIQACRQDRVEGGLEVVLVVVKMDAWRGEKARNEQRGFLGG